MPEIQFHGSDPIQAKCLTPGLWRPLFVGQDAEPYLEAVADIAEALQDPESMGNDGSLAGGQAGTALFFGYRHLATGSQADLERALNHLNYALDIAATMEIGPTLYRGLSGVGYVATFLHRRLLGQEGEDPVVEIDDHIHDLLSAPQWGGGFDLISGLTGIGVYALERLPDCKAHQCVALIIEHLESSVVRQKKGLTWRTPPESLPEFQRQMAPGGYLNLGIAHGLPSVISLLGNAVQIGIIPQRSRALLNGAVAWLLDQELPGHSRSRFPLWVPVGEGELRPARLAWCYGDIGIATVLMSVARMVGDRNWEAEAVRIARHSAAVPLDKSGVVDAGLCHGAAGLGHLFNRMYQASGDQVLGEAARFWFADALGRRQPGAGLAGFSSYSPVPGDNSQSTWQSRPGFLEGAAGIALSFVAATCEQEPVWDDVLQVGIRQGDAK